MIFVARADARPVRALDARTPIPAVPQAKSAPAVVLLVVGGGFLALLILRALRTYMLTRRAADLTVAARLRLARRDAVREPRHRLR